MVCNSRNRMNNTIFLKFLESLQVHRIAHKATVKFIENSSRNGVWHWLEGRVNVL